MNESYEFNRDGQKIRFFPAVVAMYSTWEYYPDKKLKASFVKYHDKGIDSIYSSRYYYYKINGEPDYRVDKLYENGVVIQSTKAPYSEKSKKNVPETRNKKRTDYPSRNRGNCTIPAAFILKEKMLLNIHMVKMDSFKPERFIMSKMS